MTGGYLGGWIDELLSLVSNVFLVIPQLPLIIVLAALVPTGRGPGTVIIVISVTGWAWGARVMRSITLTLRQRDYVQAARVGGESTFRVIFFEIVPNMGAIIATNFIFATISAILTEATLEFLGLSDLTQISWGTMLYWAQNNDALLGGHWSWFVPPGICIALLCTSLALINYGIDSIVNPRLDGCRSEKPRFPRLAGLTVPDALRQQIRAEGGTTTWQVRMILEIRHSERGLCVRHRHRSRRGRRLLHGRRGEVLVWRARAAAGNRRWRLRLHGC